MKYIIIILIVLSFFGCEKFCAKAHKSAHSIAKSLEKHWECDEKTVYEFFQKPLDATLCKGHQEPFVKERLIGASPICKIVYKYSMSLGAAAFSKTFKCNYAKVNETLQKPAELCILLELIPTPVL